MLVKTIFILLSSAFFLFILHFVCDCYYEAINFNKRPKKSGCGEQIENCFSLAIRKKIKLALNGNNFKSLIFLSADTVVWLVLSYAINKVGRNFLPLPVINNFVVKAKTISGFVVFGR